MDSHDLDPRSSKSLHQFIASGLDPDSVWGPQDFADILSHQLASALVDELSLVPGIDSEQVESLASRAHPPIRSFHDLILHPSPPDELLEHVKVYTKMARANAKDPVLEQVVSLIYYASIAAALLRHGTRLSTLDNAALHEGMVWSRSRPWVDPSLTDLLDQAAQALSPPDGS